MNSPVSPHSIRNKIAVFACTSSIADLPDSDLAAEVIAANCSFRIVLRSPASLYHSTSVDSHTGNYCVVGRAGAGKTINPEFILRSLLNHNKGPK